MAYDFITSIDSPNFGYPTGTRGQNDPKYIIIHHWGADGYSYDGVVNGLCRPNGVSAHAVLMDGKVTCIVNYNDAAYHAGSKYYNTHSIGIECRPEMTEGDLKTLAEYIGGDLWKKYGKLPLIGHKDVASTACPGRYYNMLGTIKSMAEAVYAGQKVQAVNVPKAKPRHQIAVDGWWGRDTSLALQKFLGMDYKDGIISMQYAPNINTCLWRVHGSGWQFVNYISSGSPTMRALQKLIGAGVDGVAGRETVRRLQGYLGVTVDGIMGEQTVKSLQGYLNSKL